MIRITLSQRPDGKDVAVCGPHRVIGGDDAGVTASVTLARHLVAAGFPDAPWEATGPDGEARLSGPSLHWWARMLGEVGGLDGC